jgi:hypothetical protein
MDTEDTYMGIPLDVLENYRTEQEQRWLNSIEYALIYGEPSKSEPLVGLLSDLE